MPDNTLSDIKRIWKEIDRLKRFEVLKSTTSWRASGIVGVNVGIPGNITAIAEVLYAVNEEGGNGINGGATYVFPGSTAVLFTDGGVNTLTLACSASGELTIRRTSGFWTYTVALWMVTI